MWPFRRRTAPPDTTPVHRAGPADWQRLAPVTIVQTSPITTVDTTFEGRLATRRSPLFVEPLGHELTPEGPSGRTAAEVVPGPPRHFGAPPVQRQTASFATPGSDVDAHDALDDAIDRTTSTGSAAPSPIERVDEIVTASDPAPPPVRPTLAAPVADQPATSLVRATDDHVAPITFAATPHAPTSHAPVVARAVGDDHDASPPGQRSDDDAAARADVVQPVQPVQRDADAAGASVVGLVGDAPTAASTPPSTPPSTAATPVDASPAPGESTAGARPGVQRAMPDTPAHRAHAGDAPPTAPADPAVTAWDALAAEAPLQAAPSPPSSPPPAGGEPSPVTTGTPLTRTTRGLVGPPISRSDGAGPSAQGPRSPLQRASEASDPSPRPPIDAQRSADPPAIAPTVDARPVPLVSSSKHPSQPVVPMPPALQRARDDSAPIPPAAPRGAPPAPVAESHASPDTVDVRPTLSASWNPGLVEPVLQRSGLGPSHAGSGDTAGARVAAPPGIAGPLQRAVDEPSPDPDAGNEVVRAGTVVPTLSAPPATRDPVTSTAITATRRGFVGAPVSRSAVQRQPIDVPARSGTGPFGDLRHHDLRRDDLRHQDHDAVAMTDVGAMPITEWPPVQRETDGQPAQEPASGAPAVTAEATSGPAAAADEGSAGRSDAEIQELLRTLYPPLRRRLCRDLLLDRERAGYATDIRF